MILLILFNNNNININFFYILNIIMNELPIKELPIKKLPIQELNIKELSSKMSIKNHIAQDLQFSPKLVNYDLTDLVVVYFDGKSHKIVLLSFMLKNHIIYDEYVDENNKKFNLSVILCPFTLAAISYVGKYVATDQTYNDNIMIKNIKEDEIYSQLNNNLVKHEVKIMLLKNVLVRYLDCLYLNVKLKEKEKIKIKVNIKNLGYGIEYKSQDVNVSSNFKYSILINKNNDYTKYDEYFKKHIDKIRERSGVIIPCLVDKWVEMFPKSKVIKI
jgi:hypothetical protein